MIMAKLIRWTYKITAVSVLFAISHLLLLLLISIFDEMIYDVFIILELVEFFLL